ncbi:thromboxane A2 receptor isoform X1 [Stigmatopora argus]
MNASTQPSSNNTPLCYTINNPPFNYVPTIASAYYSSIFTLLGVSSNLIAFVVLVKSFQRTKSSSRSSFLIFLGGLVVTDFMGLAVTGTIVISFHNTHFNWRALDPHCHFCNFMGMSMVFYGLCPLLLGAAMALERFIGIAHPFARTTLPKSRTVFMLLLVWFIAGCIALLPLAGVGSYHMQMPGSWCFFNISSEGSDLIFSVLFSMVGLTCLAVSFVLNTVSVVTLIKVCCVRDKMQRPRDQEIEMMVQLILIMAIATICWCPMLVFIAQTVLRGHPVQVLYLLLWLRFASWNQILDPWVYILFRRAILKRVYSRIDWSKWSTLNRSLRESFSIFTHSSSFGRSLSTGETEPSEKLNETPNTP